MFYSERELLRLIPKVLRARDFHLYLENGKRLVDLWLAGGRAILGHKPPMVLGELKNAAERGLFTPLPHPTERRFLKALGELFPGKTFRLYADSSSLRRALDGATEKKVSLWRPFTESPMINRSQDSISSDDSQQETHVLIPVLPWPFGPEALVLSKAMDETFPAGEIIPPVLLAPATRALYDLLAVIKDGSRLRRVYPKVEKALKDSPWRRNSIYLTLEEETDREKYTTLFKRFLEGGFLIPPSPSEPLILPASMSDGEEAKLAGLLV
jgi:hypothetical protein